MNNQTVDVGAAIDTLRPYKASTFNDIMGVGIVLLFVALFVWWFAKGK